MIANTMKNVNQKTSAFHVRFLRSGNDLSAVIVFMDNTQNKHGSQMENTMMLMKKWMTGAMVNLKRVSLIKSAAASITLMAVDKEDHRQHKQQV